MTCEREDLNKNSTLYLNGYDGIPQNLLFNIVIYLILLFIFIFLRKKTWNYSDIAWFSKPIDLMEVGPIRESRNYYPVFENDNFDLENHHNNGSRNIFWRILPLFVKLSDKQLKERCGQDAVVYCKFHRRLICIAFVMMAFSLTVIVPLNLHGALMSNQSSNFVSLTISNIKQNSDIPIVHHCIAVVFMIVTFLISNHFLNSLETDIKKLPSSTLMITNVPIGKCNELLIEQHFREAYPAVESIQVQQACNIESLFELYVKRIIAEDALIYCYNKLENENCRMMVMNNCCCRLCGNCQQTKSNDGIEYYYQEVKRITELFIEEKIKTLNEKKLPIYFVTFENPEIALFIRQEYVYQDICCIKKSPQNRSSLSDIIDSSYWKVVYASLSKDVLWQNLHKNGWRLWIPIIFINVLVGIFVIALSTPPMVLQTLSQYNIDKVLKKIVFVFGQNDWELQLATSLVLVLVSALMPLLVCWANEISCHWTKTKQNIAIMNKLFSVLVITVLILPSVGIANVPKFLEFIYKSDSSTRKSQLECIFMAGSGVLFCNYLITATFIGVGIEMLRLGDFFMYLIKICRSKSKAENNAIAKSLLWEFPFGINYGWTLALFSIMSAYAVIVPLITPFGLAYLVSKHLADRYNMINVYVRTNVGKEVHVNATKLLHICLLFTQLTVAIFVYLHRDKFDGLVISCFLVFLMGIIFIFGFSVNTTIKRLSWIKYHRNPQANEPTNIQSHTDTIGDCDSVTTDNENIFIPSPMKYSTNKALMEKIEKMSPNDSINNDFIISSETTGSTAALLNI